ncbi:hypothetical protein HHA02_28060 [Cobetia marina]|nr:hypothetical protein HHA02_28060 [Cobetia marina]
MRDILLAVSTGVAPAGVMRETISGFRVCKGGDGCLEYGTLQDWVVHPTTPQKLPES